MALKYLKDTEANIYNVLIMTGDFNIRDSDWNQNYPFHFMHNDLLLDIANAFNLFLSHSTHFFSTRYMNNSENSNLIIYLMFLWSNTLKLNNHSILLELWYSLDHAPLGINIHQIMEEVIPDVRSTIIKNSKEEIKFTSNIIKDFKKIDTWYLSSKEFLESIIQEFTKMLWYAGILTFFFFFYLFFLI